MDVSSIGSKNADIVVSEPKLIISEQDLSADVRNALKAEKEGHRLLGVENSTQALFDDLPAAIARRLRRITPPDFRLAKIDLKLQLAVDIPGFKVGGDVIVTLEPSAKTDK